IISVLLRKSFITPIIIFSLISIIIFLCTKHLYSQGQNKISMFSFKSLFFIDLGTLIYQILYVMYKALADFTMKRGANTVNWMGTPLSEEAIQQNIIIAQQQVNGMGAGLIFLTVIINSSMTIFLLYQAKKTQSMKPVVEWIEKFNITKWKEILSKEEKVDPEKADIVVCKDSKTNKPVILPYKDRFLHTLILGPTGSGKTSQTIIPFINQDMQKNCGITVIEPKGDLAEKVWALGEHYGRKVVYFNPVLPDCPYFNPLFGKEEDVIENMSTTFKMLNADSQQFFLDQNDNLVRRALKVLKRLEAAEKEDANLINLNKLVYNTNGEGRKLVIAFTKLDNVPEDVKKENDDIAGWFLDDYYKEKSKTYEHCSGLRSQVSKIISNKHLRRVLNPPRGVNDINFDKYLEEGGIIAISTAQGALRDLGKYLGYFIILQFQSAVFKRPGNENTRLGNMLYIDEFQEFSNPGFGMMLTQGRSYRVASHLATQNRDLMAMGSGRDGQNFVRLVDTNARNLIIYPGGNYGDADYYSRKFGEIHEVTDTERIVARKGAIGLNKDVDRTVTTQESKKARFSPTEIMYRPFGEITYALIINNSIQPPGIGKIEYIPMELNMKLDNMIEQLNEGRITQSTLSNNSYTSQNNYMGPNNSTINTSTNIGVNYDISTNSSIGKMDIPDKLFEVEKEIDELNLDINNSRDTKRNESNIDLDFDLDFEFDIDENKFNDTTIKNENNKDKTSSNNVNLQSNKNSFIFAQEDDDVDDLIDI
ncbi:MAG: type IV secretory system conjugative DNA transfer family protein, partial [Romboutsia sp.]|nr:type IV secretory system conjugative DNA transfer family protein [Romboutsia sp.]